MMRGGAIIRVVLAGRLRLRLWTAIAVCAVAAACGQTGSPGVPGSLAKPALVAVGELQLGPDVTLTDPGFAARIGQRMSGLTAYSVQQETVKRAGATIRDQLVASLRAGGLPAQAADTDNLRGDIITLVVTGTLRSLDEAAMRQRKIAPIGPSRSRMVVDFKVVHATDGLNSKMLATFEAEDAAPSAPVRAAAGRPNVPPAAPAAPGQESLSPDLDAHMRRIANAAAERILAISAEQGWTKAPAAAARTTR